MAWLALGLSALSFLIATSVAILYAADRLSDDAPLESAESYSLYDAGLPAWGTVGLTTTGRASKGMVEGSVERALQGAVEDFGGSADDITGVRCKDLANVKQDSVASCSLMIQDYPGTAVLTFLDDNGSYLVTLY
ncbi:hypothetical protein N802_10440 [Knoellia sinensis KCTC 19936]|uniref:DUF4333 domain-containing protein n=1 Tax=Knoellia sinensis KCTC 19936 TaxID=1385520 RepID=A0A0A0IYF8_9MICO|nr:hypothetical protein [Knoellia sinensis]KGN29838.1 hypothetical protein N802_10440 [Knoellia sinensis KCTC 19936]